MAAVFETLPKAPNRTLVIERFIALHMTIDRMNPEPPSNVPAMISTLFEIANPVAADASPAYELRSAITTGISAAPIGSTSRIPNMKASPSIT